MATLGKVAKYCHRLPREVVENLSLKKVKIRLLSVALGSLGEVGGVPAEGRRVAQDDL